MEVGSSDLNAPHSMGTTIIGVTYGGGVVLGIDSRTSTGMYVANRASDKITQLTDNVYICCSGSEQDENKDMSVPDAGVFQRILKAYATKLFARLPKGGTGIVAVATRMDGQIKTYDRDEHVICFIVNTAEYFHKTFTKGEYSQAKIDEVRSV